MDYEIQDFLKNDVMFLVPNAAFALALSLMFVDALLRMDFGSGLLRSSTFELQLLGSSSTFTRLPSDCDWGSCDFLFRFVVCCASSGKFRYFSSFWLRSSIRYSETIPAAYRKYALLSGASFFDTLNVADATPLDTWMFFCFRISATRSVFFFSQARVFSSLYLNAFKSSSP